MRRVWGSLCLLCLLFLLCTRATAQPVCVPQVTAKTSLTLAWDPQPQPAGSTVSAYIVERQVDSGAWLAITAPPLSATSTTETGLQVGHTYFYRLSLTGRLSDGTLSTTGFAEMSSTSPPCVQIIAPPLPLQVPKNFRATPQ